MAKRILNRNVLFYNKVNFPVWTRCIHNTNQIQTKEIQIPVQWGHISAKLWGNENERPILALHGWQDNAGTWDTLAPLLSKHRSILAIDFPGHGLSSWVPPGVHYYAWELPRIILFLKDYFKWDKLSLLCHSMGSIAGLRFSCLFPDDVDFYIALDSLVADDYDLNVFIDRYPSLVRKINYLQTRLNDEPPSYSFEDIVKVWHTGTRKSVSMDSARILLKRGAKQSAKDPNKYFFSRDARLKYTLFTPEKKMFVETLVRKLICPTLYIKAIDSPFSCDEFSVEMREIIAKNNEKYECHFLPGTHHIHLNNPELVFPLVLNFLQKYNFISE